MINRLKGVYLLPLINSRDGIEHIETLSNALGGQSLDRWHVRICANQDPMNVFEQVIAYFDVQFRKDILKSNRDINFIPIGSRLLKATRMFMEMREDLSPFMFQVPRILQSYENYLKHQVQKNKQQLKIVMNF